MLVDVACPLPESVVALPTTHPQLPASLRYGGAHMVLSAAWFLMLIRLHLLPLWRHLLLLIIRCLKADMNIAR